MNLNPIDFAPVIFAIVVSAFGYGFVRFLVYLRDRPSLRHGGSKGRR